MGCERYQAEHVLVRIMLAFTYAIHNSSDHGADLADQSIRIRLVMFSGQD